MRAIVAEAYPALAEKIQRVTVHYISSGMMTVEVLLSDGEQETERERADGQGDLLTLPEVRRVANDVKAQVMKLSDIVHVEVSLSLTGDLNFEDGSFLVEKMRTAEALTNQSATLPPSFA